MWHAHVACGLWHVACGMCHVPCAISHVPRATQAAWHSPASLLSQELELGHNRADLGMCDARGEALLDFSLPETGKWYR